MVAAVFPLEAEGLATVTMGPMAVVVCRRVGTDALGFVSPMHANSPFLYYYPWWIMSSPTHATERFASDTHVTDAEGTLGCMFKELAARGVLVQSNVHEIATAAIRILNVSSPSGTSALDQKIWDVRKSCEDQLFPRR